MKKSPLLLWMNLKYTLSYAVSSARIKKALEKHMNSNHEGPKSCKVCGKTLLSAEAPKNHDKNIHNKSSFKFNKSMLDEFL